MNQTDILFISHGGGPLPLLGEPGHRQLVQDLAGLGRTLPRPDAILVISAHWEAPRATVSAAGQPGLLYDYYNFPAESYDIAYPCPGLPALARAIASTLDEAGQPAALDNQRGLDHGVFVPLKIMYPAADIPVLQLSLLASLDATAHLQMGRALRALHFDGRLLVIGSGFTFHNMRSMPDGSDPAREERIAAFSDWLQDTCCNPGLDAAERERRLAHWQQAPHARFCHPREEHLLPLHVCAGLAGRPAGWHRASEVMHTRADLYRWSAGHEHAAPAHG
ncbi:DODA-type extradiol aromatic ring-opening family dioxygenase [Parahaliea mediterranea]|uniref:DODA-type extradiol aromatic ring-opening family dioxygenase n=1 Tax=Parahaliea mediterranea TaxID=651086 RepID=UPI000E2EDA1D|nr:class III extradiol ring-cleavage dioxygenase [Parahaliea mediterranea]